MRMLYNNNVKSRLRKIEGQVRGVLKLMEENKDCKEVVNQLSAVRNASDKALAYIVAVNLQECLRQSEESDDDHTALVDEAVNLLVKSR
ncbi:metal-sensitive transcriptional regulator [Bacillota bacterium Lsc_1132]